MKISRRKALTGICAGLAGLSISGCAKNNLRYVPSSTSRYFPNGYSHINSRSNVILLSIDTLRQDFLGCYGFDKNTTPNIDEFAKDAIKFDDNISSSSWTLPAHASMFTGTDANVHGCLSNSAEGIDYIPNDFKTLPEVFLERGYDTYSFNGGVTISEEHGFNRGFKEHESDLKMDTKGLVKKILSSIGSKGDNPFFVFGHTFHVHLPYNKTREFIKEFSGEYKGDLPDEFDMKTWRRLRENPDQVTEEDKKHIIGTYCAGIKSMDKEIGILIESLKEKGLYDNTTIVLTSDHGEDFWERGDFANHGHNLNMELIRTPLIIKLPKSTYRNRIVRDTTRIIDIPSTLLACSGINPYKAINGIQGKDLFNWFSEERQGLIANSFLKKNGIHHSITTRDLHYIINPKKETNVYSRNGKDKFKHGDEKKLAKKLSLETKNINFSSIKKVKDPKNSMDMERKLEELGYI